MKLMSKLFRRKPSPPTPKEGRNILQEAIERTLDNGLNGYVIAEVGNEKEGEMIFSAHGNLGEGLSKALQILLENPETHNATQFAIIEALRATSAVAEVRVVTDPECECSVCTARRVMESRHTTAVKH